MINYIYGDSLSAFPNLAASMFADRADQFKARLNWAVDVDKQGHERDCYDKMNPLYIIYHAPDGSHGGSMRVLPTIGQTMVNDHFLDLTGGVRIESPLIWECTRFCLSPNLRQNAGEVAASLMLAGCELGLRFGLEHSVGVFDARMVRIYRRIGWEPDVLGTTENEDEKISVGLWPIDEASKLKICARSGIDPRVSETWFDASFPEYRDVMVA